MHKMNKVHLIGAHGVGKTTLAKLVAKYRRVTFIEGPARELKLTGKNLTSQQQMRITQEQLKKENIYSYVCDRSVIDQYAYSIVNGLDLHSFYEDILKEYAKDKTFFLVFPFSKEVPEDGVRQQNTEDRQRVHDTIVHLLNKYEINYFIIDSTKLEERVYSIINILENNVVKIDLVEEGAIFPHKGYNTDGAYDLHACEEVVVKKGVVTEVKCGLKIVPPVGYMVRVWARSSTMKKKGLLVHPALIDPGFSGVFSTFVVNVKDTPYVIKKGEKFAQFTIEKIEKVVIAPCKVFDKNEIRGKNGVGSTGD